MQYLTWAFVALAGAVPFIGPHLGYAGTLFLMSGAVIGYALTHGSARYGWGPIAVFLIVGFVIGNIFEDLSITTGFPYGYFHHLPVEGPRIWHVPIVVGLSHAAAAYLAWSMGSALLGRADAAPRRTAALAIAIVGAFVVTGWDATGDASGATVARGWVYPNGGGYFGVPLSNFLGWLLAGGCYTLAAGLCLPRTVRPQGLAWSLQPAVLMLLLACAPILALALPDQVVQDPSGQAWRTRDLFETESVAAIVGPIFAGVMALIIALRARPEDLSPPQVA
jgi:putative membrane protein